MEMQLNKSVGMWLFAVSAAITFMVLFGGWVRLSGSGLSMVEWHVVTGVIPPLSTEAWEEAYGDYQQSPEYKKINTGMGLDEYKSIYYMEYAHRILGRLVGLGFVVPLFIFLARGTIPWRCVTPYFGIGLLFALQGLVGWLMVQSGLIDDPHVSHYRLTLHLMCAVALLGACLWLAFGHAMEPSEEQAGPSPQLRILSMVLLAAVSVQLAAGGLVAGMKAGFVSNTFPKMRGQWLPDGLFALEPLLCNLGENHITLHFQHRWFAFVVLGLAVALMLRSKKEGCPRYLQSSSKSFLHLVFVQILLGIAVIVLSVPPWMASLHQTVGLALFALAVFICHGATKRSVSMSGSVR